MNPDLILGLSGIDGRLAVGLVRDGRVLFAVEEDKLRRFRGLGLQHLKDIGSRALSVAMAVVPGGIRAIGRVAYVPSVGAVPVQVNRETELIQEFLKRHYGASPPVDAVDHVEAHFAFERAVHPDADHVFMLGRSSASYSARPGETPCLDVPCRLVSVAERLAAFAGFPPARIHHLENMARYGEPRFTETLKGLLDEGIEQDTAGLEAVLGEATGLRRRLSGEPLDSRHYDFAASVYEVLKTGTIGVIRSVPEDKRRGTIAVCGGVFQSWTLNDSVAAAFPGNRFLASFAPGNASGAIGGPLVSSGSALKEPVGPFLGPEYSREEVKAVLDNAKVRYALHSLGETTDLVCEALEAGRMVGWFGGRCEFGYRALGARSVFASPANPYACDNLSSYLKKRPGYFAYAVAIDGNNALVRGLDSPYLSRSAILGEYFGDARVRIQSVSKIGVPPLWQLLEAFRKKTGVPALLNTSLNYFDEPIACEPRDALKTFYASGLDMLVMEGFVLAKD